MPKSRKIGKTVKGAVAAMATRSSVGRTSGTQATESGRHQATVHDLGQHNSQSRYNLRSNARKNDIQKDSSSEVVDPLSVENSEINTSSFEYLISQC